MPDNWGFVFAAYGLTAAVLALYWRRLVRRDREISALAERTRARNEVRRGGRPAAADPLGRPPRLEPGSSQ